MDQPRNITKIKLGPVLLDCTTAEEVSKTADVTDRPVEKGEDISDHMKTKPYSVRLSGVMVNDAEGKISTLEKMMADAKLVEYIGKRKLRDMVITSFSTKQNKQIANGYEWDLTLQSVKIAKPQTIKQKVKNPVSKQTDKKVETKIKQVTNAGRKQMLTTSNSNGNYTNRNNTRSRVATQKPLKRRQSKPNTIMKRSVTRNPISVAKTNPVRARNKMLSTLTTGTRVRTRMTLQRRSNMLRNFGGSRKRNKGGGSR